MPAMVTVYIGHRQTLLLPARDHLPDYHVHRHYFEIITFSSRTRPGRGLN